jgi:hypothetical protein
LARIYFKGYGAKYGNEEREWSWMTIHVDGKSTAMKENGTERIPAGALKGPQSLVLMMGRCSIYDAGRDNSKRPSYLPFR